ncbi:hypothetical protein LCGC14_2017360, partial [marine sediment metagenome]
APPPYNLIFSRVRLFPIPSWLKSLKNSFRVFIEAIPSLKPMNLMRAIELMKINFSTLAKICERFFHGTYKSHLTIENQRKIASHGRIETHYNYAGHAGYENHNNFASQYIFETHESHASHFLTENHNRYASHKIYETQWRSAII